MTIAAAAALVLAACGSSTQSSSPKGPTVEVNMADIAYQPAEVTVPKGTKVTFRFRNSGKVAHDAFIGDAAEQADHEHEMASSMGGMHHGNDSNAVTVDPGKTATMTHTFDESGITEIGCHQPGHYAAGMKLMVSVQ